MQELNLPPGLKDKVSDFLKVLKSIFAQDLISVILYGSAASGEFVEKRSNLNLLVVLKNSGLENLKKASGVVNKSRLISPLFLTERYIASSTDIFPIEFLDMKENYEVLYGKDVLKDIVVETVNLRFQCEQELKAKLIGIKHFYLKINKDQRALGKFLLESFTPVLHVLRNVLRLKGKKPAYQKKDLLKALAAEFEINLHSWETILAAKQNEVKLGIKTTYSLFANFVDDLEGIVEAVDKL